LREQHSNQEIWTERDVMDCRSDEPLSSFRPVRWAIAALLFTGGSEASASLAPLFDSVRLNIGLNCRWEQRCIASQTRAMHSALGYVQAHHPSQSRIHLCNRNATRGRFRTDWIGFDNCIRNGSLKRP
jgi:hypothetical protein